MILRCCWLISFLGPLCWIPGASAADRPQWGQPFSRNMVSDEKGLPETFDPITGKNIRWTAELGTQTYSTPVIARGKVLIGTNNGRPRDPRHQGDSGVLLCLEEKDGHLCWQLVIPKQSKNPFDDWPQTGLVSPVTVEGDRVYLVSNRGEVLCLDLQGQANGNDGPYRDESRHMTRQGNPLLEVTATDADILWLFDMVAEVGIHTHDASHGSVLVHGPYLYVCSSNGVNDAHMQTPALNAPSLIVLDKATGRLVATDDEHIGPNIIHNTWSSPSLGVVNGRPLVFFCGGNAFCYAFEALRLLRRPALPSYGGSGVSTAIRRHPSKTSTSGRTIAEKVPAISWACRFSITTACT